MLNNLIMHNPNIQEESNNSTKSKNLNRDTIDNANIKKSSEFNKIINKKLDNNSISHKNKTNGMNIADKELLNKNIKEYAVKLEKQLLTTMWEKASQTFSQNGENEMINVLYHGQYIAEMVDQAYGEEGGPLAEAMTEKLMVDYGDYQQNYRGEKRTSHDKKY